MALSSSCTDLLCAHHFVFGSHHHGTLGREKKKATAASGFGLHQFHHRSAGIRKLIELLSVRVIIPSILIGSLLLTLISLTLPLTGDRKNLCWHMELRL